MSGKSAKSAGNDAGHVVLIYDERCRFCIAQTQRLARWGRAERVELRRSDDPDAVAMLGSADREWAGRTLLAVREDGRVFHGYGAVIAALNTRGSWRLVTWVYRVWPVRWLCDLVYGLIARNRYRLGGSASNCETGQCGTRC